MGLCENCQRLLRFGYAPVPVLYYSNNHCQSCSLLTKAIKENANILGALPTLRQSQDGLVSLRLDSGEMVIDIYAREGVSNPWQLDFHFVEPESNDSRATIHQVLEWSQQCVSTHTKCKVPENTTLPTRVLDIGSCASDKMKLLVSGKSKGQYACLSYCWGKSAFIKTTNETLEQHLENISSEKLPQVFKDAIRIAHEFQIRYLWIDALCIIQGDTEDWMKESKCMADIYRNSSLTIAAVSAVDVHQNLFSGPKPVIPVDSVISVPLSHFPNSGSNANGLGFPMLSRAWTYQERMLSPRVLYVGRYEMLWDCFECRTCQCGKARHKLDEVKKTALYDTCLQQERKLEHNKPRILWRNLVIEYSALRLTYSKDKLPAISALADSMYRDRGKSYLAGLWEETLILDLCWFRYPHDARPSQNHEPTAPTWSWASVDVSVMYPDDLYGEYGNQVREHAVLKQAFCDPDGESATGNVKKGGFIDLECELAPITSKDSESCEMTDGRALYYIADQRPTSTINSQSLYAILLSSTHCSSNWWVYWYMVVTQQSQNFGRPQVYQRVGFARNTSKDLYKPGKITLVRIV